MSEQDNIFPFGKFDNEVGGKPDDKIMAVLNGLQGHLMMAFKKIDELEYRVKGLEDAK